MAISAMVALANLTLGSAQATVTFSSIPATYRDLRLVWQGTGSAANSLYIKVNADAGTNYSFVYMAGWSTTNTGSATGSNGNGLFIGSANIGISSTDIQTSTVDIMDYSATDKHKTALARWNQSAEVDAIASRWASLSAITSLQVYITGGATMGSGTTLALYGIVS